MAKPLISIIVPVYKVEQYLDECVQSILHQSYSNLEIILVDDGSPDNCPEMCDEYAKYDSRIKVIHKQNGGLSSARNAGLDFATGEYIGFVDSDDYIALNMYERLLENFKLTSGIGLVKCLIWRDTDGVVTPYGHWSFRERNLIDSSEYANCFITEKLSNSVCDMLFEASLLKNSRFPEGKVNEDSLFHYYFSKVIEEKKCSLLVIPERHYYYRCSSESICNSSNKPFSINVLSNIKEMLADSIAYKRGLDSMLQIKLFAYIYLLNMQLLSNSTWKKELWNQYHPLISQVPFSDVSKIWGFRHLCGLFLLKYLPVVLNVKKVRLFCNNCGEIPPCV